jgi:hypothetical protein
VSYTPNHPVILSETTACIAAVYLNWYTTDDALDVDNIEDDIISDLSRPIGGGGIFV